MPMQQSAIAPVRNLRRKKQPRRAAVHTLALNAERGEEICAPWCQPALPACITFEDEVPNNMKRQRISQPSSEHIRETKDYSLSPYLCADATLSANGTDLTLAAFSEKTMNKEDISFSTWMHTTADTTLLTRESDDKLFEWRGDNYLSPTQSQASTEYMASGEVSLLFSAEERSKELTHCSGTSLSSHSFTENEGANELLNNLYASSSNEFTVPANLHVRNASHSPPPAHTDTHTPVRTPSPNVIIRCLPKELMPSQPKLRALYIVTFTETGVKTHINLTVHGSKLDKQLKQWS